MDIAAQELNRVRGPFACGVADKGRPDQCSMDRTIERSAADEAPWGAIWSRFHRRTDAMAPSASNAIAATTVPQAVECGAARTDPTAAP